jgi:transposase InsO family protein
MSASGLAGVSRRKFVHTTVKGGGRQAPDLVDRNFTAERLNLLWVADITYIPTWAGFLYLAVVLDACSRRIVGWSMATTLATRLVLDALNMALAMRRPKGVIHHSDQGSQYASIEFGHRCREAGVRPHPRAGREEWLRRGPNKRMAPNRRAKCATLIPSPQPSTKSGQVQLPPGLSATREMMRSCEVET